MSYDMQNMQTILYIYTDVTFGLFLDYFKQRFKIWPSMHIEICKVYNIAYLQISNFLLSYFIVLFKHIWNQFY